MQGWHIYLNGTYVDTVFYIKEMTEAQVKKSLVEYDDFPVDIILVKE